jgi:V/A-type H+-transporting ATPase subunit A
VKVFWALDAKLAQKRHFPSINWLSSYSLYSEALADWFTENVATDWVQLKSEAMDILQEESELQEIVQLVGSDALPEDQQLKLEIARMLREYFLQQNAFHPVDTYCPFDKQYKLLKAISKYNDMATSALESGAMISDIVTIESKDELAKVKYEEDFDGALNTVLTKMDEEFAHLGGK